MADKFREKLGYLSDEIEENSHLRSNSPHIRADSKNGSRSPRRVSRSPHPYPASVDQQPPTCSLSHRSHPEIAAWPAPNPSVQNIKPVAKTNPVRPTSSVASPLTLEEPLNLNEDSNQLLSILKNAAATNAGRGRESELRRKIQNLEETVADYEREKFNVMGSFTEYRERVVERERKLEAEYSGKIITLSEEVLSAKKDFEARMKNFQALQERFEKEKQQALEKMRLEHQKEIQILEQRFSASQLLNLEQKYIIEIQRLEEERKSLRAEKERLGETFEVKLRRAQSLYETELSAAKMLYTKELEALRDHEEALKEELSARQEEFHDRLQELEHQAKQSKDEMNVCRQDVAVLEKKLKAKEAECTSIAKDLLQLSSAATETQRSLFWLDSISNNFDDLKIDYKEQAEQLQLRIEMLKVAEATKTSLEVTIKELQMEVRQLKSKVEFLDKERENLQSQSESQTLLQNSQVKALEAVLESLTEEKKTTREHYEKLLTIEREQAEEREFSMKKEFSIRLNEIEEQYSSLREHLEGDQPFDTANIKLWKEIESLRSEKTSLEEEVATMRSQLRTVNETKDEPDSKFTLDYVIELLRAIESVKSKVTKGGSNKASVTSKSKENSIDTDNHRILDVDVATLKEQLREELKGNKTNRGPELDLILSRLRELETSLNEIVVEKNGALQKVEELKIENERMVEQLHTTEQNSTDNLIIIQLKENINAQTVQIADQSRLIDEKTAEIDAYKARLEANDKKMADNKQSATEAELKLLRDELTALTKSKENVEAELKSHKAEMAKLSQTTEEYVRQRDQKQTLIYEKKLETLKEEHANEIQVLRDTASTLQTNLSAALSAMDKFNTQKIEKLEVAEDGVQTDNIPDNSENNKKEIEDLLKMVEALRAEVAEKDEMMAAMKTTIKVDDESEHFDFDRDAVVGEEKKSPQNINVTGSMLSEPPATCHKSMFQTFVSQMTDKKERRESKINAADAKKAEKKKEREQKELKKIADSAIMTRSKSPSLLTRLRDRSPSKTKFLSPEPSSPSPTSPKNLLSPIDAERTADERLEMSRRSSPSRPLFARKTKEGSEPMDKSEKRPAWKF